MKITEDHFVPLLCQKHEKALEYCMLHYGGLVKALDCKRKYASHMLETSWDAMEEVIQIPMNFLRYLL